LEGYDDVAALRNTPSSFQEKPSGNFEHTPLHRKKAIVGVKKKTATLARGGIRHKNIAGETTFEHIKSAAVSTGDRADLMASQGNSLPSFTEAPIDAISLSRDNIAVTSEGADVPASPNIKASDDIPIALVDCKKDQTETSFDQSMDNEPLKKTLLEQVSLAVGSECAGTSPAGELDKANVQATLCQEPEIEIKH